MTVDEAFAKVFKDLREKRGYTQGDMADALGFSRQAVWDIENRYTSVKLSTFYRVADMFGITEEELVSRTSNTRRTRID